jgi:hypothetical protein
MTKFEIFESVNVNRLSSLEQEIVRLQEENKIMKMICTTKGFFQYYFEMLKNFASVEDCFNYVNSLYEKYFGPKKYNSYNHFKTVVYGN